MNSEVKAREGIEERLVNCPLCNGKENFLSILETRYDGHLVKCKVCNFYFLNPQKSFNGVEKAYRTKKYLNFLNKHSSKENNYTKEIVKSLDGKVFFNSTGRRLLDIGCGNGNFLKMIKEMYSYDVWGNDICDEAIKFCREVQNFNVCQGFFEDIEYEENYFDIVILWSVVAHVKRPLELFQKVYSILKNNGVVLIHTVNINSLSRFIKSSQWGGFRKNHISFFSPETIKYALTKAKFSDIEICKLPQKPKDSLVKKIIKTFLNELNLRKMMLVIAFKRELER